MKRRGLPLRWRLVLLVGSAIALLGLATVTTSYFAVRASLLTDLRVSLREDASRVAALYGGGQPGSANEQLSGPTGGVVVSLYDLSGRLLASSSPQIAALPASIVQSASGGSRDWQGVLDGDTVLAALAPFGVGIAVVSSGTEYIASALSQVARILTGIGVVVVLVGAFVGYAIARSALAPLRNLARQAARIGPDRLETISYRGPDDELGLLSRVVNQLVGRLGAALSVQRQFLLETSHELRTPLTSLQGFLDRAVRRADPQVADELSNARRIASNMSRLVEDLLQLTRGEHVRELVPHLVDARGEVLENIAREFPGVRACGEEGLYLLGDPGRLRQLIRNLVANAVRSAGEAEVELELSQDGAQALMVVRDNGPSIPPEARERIFDKFFKGAGGGAGLGLAIARQIAEQHGGSISLTSRPGLTEFTVRIPLVEMEP